MSDMRKWPTQKGRRGNGYKGTLREMFNYTLGDISRISEKLKIYSERREILKVVILRRGWKCNNKETGKSLYRL